jgi:hypothetical protein
MTALTLPFPSGRGSREPSLWETVTDFFAAIREGLAVAARYEAMECKTDAELAQLGLSRADIPRVALADRDR